MFVVNLMKYSVFFNIKLCYTFICSKIMDRSCVTLSEWCLASTVTTLCLYLYYLHSTLLLFKVICFFSYTFLSCRLCQALKMVSSLFVWKMEKKKKNLFIFKFWFHPIAMCSDMERNLILVCKSKTKINYVHIIRLNLEFLGHL